MSTRKEELRDAALRYLLKHGIANVSLRPLAAELGTSPRILLFHFKSKEGLLQEVMQQLHRRLQGTLMKVAKTRPHAVRAAPLKLFWQSATRKDNFPYLRLMYEWHIIAAQNPAEYGAYLEESSKDWHLLARQSISDDLRSDSLATLCIAVFDGLVLELMATGDNRRLSRALDDFIALVRGSQQSRSYSKS